MESSVSHWSVICDFDGTISVEDVTDSLLVRFGRPGWDVLEADWREGRIGSRECMSGQIALLDCSRAELVAHLSAMAIDPDFPAFVAAARQADVQLRIVSDGLDYVIQTVLARHGLHDLSTFASHLVQVGPRRWRLEFPNARADCRTASGTCKCAFADPPATARGTRILLIGDGASDFCLADRVDLIYARKRLLEYCLDGVRPYYAVANFKQALGLLPELLAATSAGVPAILQD
jgi:2-hydroxy-3-keto-5-methylthiopentenyl-1-phosphate phosphatase